MQRREFQFIQDTIPDGVLPRARAKTPPLIVPEGVSFLSVDALGELQVAATSLDQSADGEFLLQPVWGGQLPQLLVINPGHGPALVNGRTAPQLFLLNERDQFQPDAEHLLHVVLHNRPEIGPPAESRLGSECPVCRSKIDGTKVYTCFNCGTAIHLQGDDVPIESRLECALTITCCPVCAAKIELAAGYSWEPELYCG
jgi:hypothetical protein